MGFAVKLNKEQKDSTNILTIKSKYNSKIALIIDLIFGFFILVFGLIGFIFLFLFYPSFIIFFILVAIVIISFIVFINLIILTPQVKIYSNQGNLKILKKTLFSKKNIEIGKQNNPILVKYKLPITNKYFLLAIKTNEKIITLRPQSSTYSGSTGFGYTDEEFLEILSFLEINYDNTERSFESLVKEAIN